MIIRHPAAPHFSCRAKIFPRDPFVLMAQTQKSSQIGCSLTVVLRGFEPRQAEPKTAVLPLHHKTILTSETHRLICVCKVKRKKGVVQIFAPYFAIIR